MKGVKAYQKVQVMTSGGVRLVVMLYEGVIKFNRLAVMAVRENNIKKRTDYINRSVAIISELYNALDMERGGEVARNLHDMYVYCLGRLSEANKRNSAEIIEEVTGLFAEVKGGWEALTSSKPPASNTAGKRAAHGT